MSTACSITRQEPASPLCEPRLRLYCFHHAGGNAASFATWPQALPGFDVWAVQLPNRYGGGAVAVSRMEDLLPPLLERFDACQQTALPPLPFAFYGHSLGALVAYELGQVVHRRGEAAPFALAVSGHRAPGQPLRRTPLHDLSQERLVEQLRRLQGMPAGLLDNPKLLPYLLPMLRADLRLSEQYPPADHPPLPIPLLGFRGSDDPILAAAEFEAWSQHSSKPSVLRTLPGGHFFDAASLAMLQRHLADDLTPLAVELGLKALAR